MPLIDRAPSLGVQIGCATGEIEEIHGAIQAYWPEGPGDRRARPRSLVLRRDDVDEIYVLAGRDPDTSLATVSVYEDEWTVTMPSEPEACAVLSPAEGFMMPTEGIGKTWCEENLRFLIGWPVRPAQEVTVVVQPLRTGLLIEVPETAIESLQIAIDWENERAITLETR